MSRTYINHRRAPINTIACHFASRKILRMNDLCLFCEREIHTPSEPSKTILPSYVAEEECLFILVDSSRILPDFNFPDQAEKPIHEVTVIDLNDIAAIDLDDSEFASCIEESIEEVLCISDPEDEVNDMNQSRADPPIPEHITFPSCGSECEARHIPSETRPIRTVPVMTVASFRHKVALPLPVIAKPSSKYSMIVSTKRIIIESSSSGSVEEVTVFPRLPIIVSLESPDDSIEVLEDVRPEIELLEDAVVDLTSEGIPDEHDDDIKEEEAHRNRLDMARREFHARVLDRLSHESSYDFSSHYPHSTILTPKPSTPEAPDTVDALNSPEISKKKSGFWKRILRVFVCGTRQMT